MEDRITPLVERMPATVAAEVLQIARDADRDRFFLIDHVENLQRMNEGHCCRIHAQHEVIQKLTQELADERKKRAREA